MPDSDFCLSFEKDFLQEDLRLWCFQSKGENGHAEPLILCSFPTVMDLESKKFVFDLNVNYTKELDSIRPLHQDLLLKLDVRRASVLEDTFKQLAAVNHSHYKFPLVVDWGENFDDDDDDDDIPLYMKDFFYEVFDEMVSADSGMFMFNDSKTLAWFPSKQQPGSTLQPQPGPTLQQQPGSTHQQQPGPTLQQQPGSTLQQQPGSTHQQQPGPTLQQQPGSTLQQQPGPTLQPQPGATLQPQPGPTLQQQPGPTLQPQPGPSLQQQPGSTLQPQPCPSLQQQPGPSLQQQPGSTLQQQPGSTLQQRPSSTLQQRPGPSLKQQPSSTLQQQPGPAQLQCGSGDQRQPEPCDQQLKQTCPSDQQQHQQPTFQQPLHLSPAKRQQQRMQLGPGENPSAVQHHRRLHIPAPEPANHPRHRSQPPAREQQQQQQLQQVLTQPAQHQQPRPKPVNQQQHSAPQSAATLQPPRPPMNLPPHQGHGLVFNLNYGSVMYSLLEDTMPARKKELFELIISIVCVKLWKTRCVMIIKQTVIDCDMVVNQVLTDLRRRKTLDRAQSLPWNLLDLEPPD
ncbi:hypothetical protein ABVT39_000409 [Epinephelus coioides]